MSSICEHCCVLTNSRVSVPTVLRRCYPWVTSHISECQLRCAASLGGRGPEPRARHEWPPWRPNRRMNLNADPRCTQVGFRALDLELLFAYQSVHSWRGLGSTPLVVGLRSSPRVKREERSIDRCPISSRRRHSSPCCCDQHDDRASPLQPHRLPTRFNRTSDRFQRKHHQGRTLAPIISWPHSRRSCWS
jgi:hypothetical protein